jgi:predicted metal-binding protein
MERRLLCVSPPEFSEEDTMRVELSKKVFWKKKKKKKKVFFFLLLLLLGRCSLVHETNEKDKCTEIESFRIAAAHNDCFGGVNSIGCNAK